MEDRLLQTRTRVAVRRGGHEGLARLKRRVESLEPRTLLAIGAAAGALALSPKVTHRPLRQVLPYFGPMAAGFGAAPATGLYLHRRREHERVNKRELALAGLGGSGAWVAQRSLYHGLPAVVPRRFWNKAMLESAALHTKVPARLAFLGGHALPLALAGGSAILLADELRRRKGQHHRGLENLRRAALIGAGTFGGMVGAKYGLPLLLRRPLPRVVRKALMPAGEAVLPSIMFARALQGRERAAA